MKNEPLTSRYRPTKLSEIQGHNSSLAELKSWLKDFPQDSTPQLLYGPPGTGKSSTVQAFANEFDVPLTEINASDSRKSDDIEEFASEISSQPFSAEYKIILLDEVDSMSGRANLTPLYDALENPCNPGFLVCNEKYEVPNKLVNLSNEHNFSLGSRSVKAKLKKIVQEEDFDVGASTISMLAKRGNLRDAIQDLQTYAGSYGEDASTTRRSDNSIFDNMERVRKGKPVSFSETPRDAVLWVDKNIRGRYRMVEAAGAWEALSLSDKYNARVWQGQGDPDYRWWRYSGNFVEFVPLLRLTEAYDGYVQSDSPSYYGYDDVSSEVESVFEKVSGDYFGSFLHFRRRVVPILQSLDIDERCEFAFRYGLEGDELSVLELSEAEYGGWKERQTSENERSSDESSTQSSFMDW